MLRKIIIKRLFAFVFAVVWLRSVHGEDGMCWNKEDGKLPKLYNTLTHECKNGTIRPRSSAELPINLPPSKKSQYISSTSSPNTLSTSSPTSSTWIEPTFAPGPPITRPRPTPDQSNRRELDVPCKHILSHALSDIGYKCCGRGIYHPRFQTCCMEMVYNYKVHMKTKGMEYACCGLDAFPRDKMPCRGAARNDRLWKPKPIQQLCKVYDYTFLLTIENHEGENNRFIATIKALSDKGKLISGNSRKIPTPYDGQTPKGQQNKSYIIRSNTNHLSYDFLDFFVENDDLILKVTKRQERNPDRVLRNLKRIANCKK